MRRVLIIPTLCVAMSVGAADIPRNIFDARVPMRDGVELSADIWLPPADGQYPAILMRTPYVKALGRELKLGRDMQKKFALQGYVFIIQDVRGRGDSDGVFLAGGEGNDGHDTVEWISIQPWSNGNVCTMGLSYLGAVQWAAARKEPPHMRCMAPVATGSMPDVMFINGAVSSDMIQWVNITSGRMDQRRIAATLDWNAIFQHRPLIELDDVMGRPMPLYDEILSSEDPDFDLIQGTAFGLDDFRRIRLPALHVTGWFDTALNGTLKFWRGMAMNSPASDKQHLLIGPWDHVQTLFGGGVRIGEIEFSPEAQLDIIDLHLRFYDHYLKNATQSFDFPRVRLYVTGSNQWRDLDAYPPLQSRQQKLYLHSAGNANSLAGEGSLEWNPPGDESADHYNYDPRNPVLISADGKPFELSSFMQLHGSDQRSIEERKDVLIYTGPILEQALELIGSVSVELYASSDALDTDFTVKLVDVYPDARAVRLGPVNAGIIRARFRNGRVREQLLTPGKIEKYHIPLADIGHTFLAGHRIRLEISSSAYPQVLPNQNTGNPIATDTDWKVAHQSVYHNGTYPSAVLLPVFHAQID